MPSKTFFHLPAEKRERLLLAAEEEFARVPYAEASINRMIRAAGIPRGSFYMYFRDKEELFHYLLKRYQDGLLQRLERVLEEQGGDLLGALPALFDDLRAQRKHWAGLARMLSRNSDMRLGLRLSPLDRPDLGEWLERRVDRDRLEPKHFKKWVDFCKARGLGADFNPTFFSHPKCDPLTLASPNEETRKFWVEHGKACIRISQYLAEELGQPCTMNIWTGDGFKDVPADRKGPRDRYKASIDEILSEPYDFKLVKPCIESKVFGIGVEAYTVGSAEFALSYAAFNREKCIPLMDNGHYHPTEVVSDKIPALLAFFPEIALHVTRPIRWDSDHVVLFDDETKEICKEIVRCGGLDGRVNIALDYFDASINRISAWTVGFRNVEKALLSALCTPHTVLKELQDTNQFTELMVRQEELKTLPFGEVWDEYCRRNSVPVDGAWFEEVKKYEQNVLSKRI